MAASLAVSATAFAQTEEKKAEGASTEPPKDTAAPPKAEEPKVLPAAESAVIPKPTAAVEKKAEGASTEAPHPAKDPKKDEKPWYERIHIRGYTQVRYNRLFASNDELVSEQGDKSIGDNGGFFIRRGRVILFGDVHERVSIYLQPDFANAIAGNAHVVALRDWYADIFLDPDKTARFRVGQSKVPYGFENMQSSQNRLPFDRSDPINSSVSNERDLGFFFYWAPKEIRKRFKHLVDSGLKGTGDYGVIGLGFYNGQVANVRDANDNKHVVARVSYPFQFGEQFVEVGIQGYAGRYVVAKDAVDAGIKGGGLWYRDMRAALSLTVYPQPFGFQAEYNYGIGPELDIAAKTIRGQTLHGGYAMVMFKAGSFIPFVRGAMYDGGKKHEKNAMSYDIKEVEAGLEWLPWKALELTLAGNFSERTNPKTFLQERGRLIRIQVQFNY